MTRSPWVLEALAVTMMLGCLAPAASARPGSPATGAGSRREVHGAASTDRQPLTARQEARLDPVLRAAWQWLERARSGVSGSGVRDGVALAVVGDPKASAPGMWSETARAAGLPPRLTPDTTLRLVVRADDPGALVAAGATLRAYSGGVASVTVPAGRLGDLARVPGVWQVSLPEALVETNDLGRADAQVPEVERLLGMDGRGTSVVIVDSGIDFTHQAFRDAAGHTRIKALLDLADPGDTDCDGELDGRGPAGGTLFTREQIDHALADIEAGRSRVHAWMAGPEAIPSPGTLQSTVVVRPDEALAIDTLHVRVRIEHPYVGDLALALVGPGDRRAVLLAQAQAGAVSLSGTYPVPGLTGRSTAGTWRLEVSDDDVADTGFLVDWALLVNRAVRQEDLGGHGTHVAGSAAGDDAGPGTVAPGRYAGVAPGADLIVVRASRVMGGSYAVDDLMAALGWATSYGRSEGAPFVVNWSLGGFYGARDGTTAMEQYIDGLFGPGRDGRVLVASAGNEGDRRAHAGGVFGPSDEAVSLQIAEDTEQEAIELWFRGPPDARLGIVWPTGGATRCHTADLDLENQRSDCSRMQLVPGDVRAILFVDRDERLLCYGTVEWASRSSANNLFRLGLRLAAREAPVLPGHWQLRLEGADGAWNAWSSAGEPFGSAGDNRMTIGSPGAARQAITVGSHTTRTEWSDAGGERHSPGGSVGALSAYSARGPTRDGRRKPELTAAGEWIVSPASSSASWAERLRVDAGHRVMSGTSMAAPFVTGAVALLLSQSGGASLDTAEVRALLASGCRADGFTGAVANDDWGAGKLDAFGSASALRLTPAPTASVTVEATPTRTDPAVPTASVTTRPPVARLAYLGLVLKPVGPGEGRSRARGSAASSCASSSTCATVPLAARRAPDDRFPPRHRSSPQEGR